MPYVKYVISDKLRAYGVRGDHLLVTVDIVAAVLVFSLGLGVIITSSPGPGLNRSDWVNLPLLVALSGAVAFRRKYPMGAFTVAFAATALSAALGTGDIAHYALAYVFYIVIVTKAVRVSVAALCACILSPLPALLLDALSFWAYAASTWFFITLVAIAGYTVRRRQIVVIQRAQERMTRNVIDERLRIARELHDVVGHTMTLIAVKAAVANHVAAVRPAEAYDALRIIEATSKAALVEIRRTLGILRTQHSTPSLESAHGLNEVPELIAHAREAGVTIGLKNSVKGQLPESIDRTAYRIVQEALTNVVKHAAPTNCYISIAATTHAVDITVTNEAGAESAPRYGGAKSRGDSHGLVGMRERVLLHNGTFRAAPTPEGGFEVSATLRWDEQENAS